MKILAIEREIKNIDCISKYSLLEKEAKSVYEMYRSGLLREHYFNEKNNAVLIFECEGIETVNELLNTLPLVEKGCISFDIMQLLPYIGYDRLIK